MTTAQTPSDAERLARGLEEGFCGYAAWLQPAAAELRRLQADNERLLAQVHKLEMDALDLASENSILKRAETAELEARKPLPLSYLCGTLISGIDGATTVSLHFSDLVEANAWFEGITDQFDAALVDKSPDLQEPLVDKTAKLQDRPAAPIASREVVSDGPLRVTRLHLTEEGRAALTSKAAGPLPGITGGSS